MVERVEMSRRNVVVDGKVYSVKRESEPVFLLRLSDLSVRYLVVIADAIDFHGFRRLVWPINAEQISVDRKSTRLNSSHQIISYAVFCLKKKKKRRLHNLP